VFLSAEDLKAVRLKGSKVIELAGLSKKIRLTKLTGAAALELPKLQDKIKAGQADQIELFKFLLSKSCTDEAGEYRLTAEDAQVLVDELPYETVTSIVNQITEELGAKPQVEPGKG
jgi:hypothetical protein